jgi:biotin synthase
MSTTTARHNLALDDVRALFERPLLELVFEAASVHREHHDPSRIQCSELLSIKTGGCPEDCGYCSQSAHHQTQLAREPLLGVAEVTQAAAAAARGGADRFCMGAAWREVADGPEFERVLEMVRAVKNLGLETCVTLGMLEAHQARRLKEAGLDYYNHNLDTGRSHYDQIVSTRGYDDRLETLRAVREAGIHVCSGGILGMGESRAVRAELLHELASLDPQPESVPINALVPIAGTPLAESARLDWTELVRAVAAARLLMPRAVVRLSAGLLTTPNPEPASDAALLAKLGLAPVRRAGLE